MGHFCAGFLNVMLSGGREHGLRAPVSGGALGEGSGSVLCPDPLVGSSCAPPQVLSSRVSAGPWSLTLAASFLAAFTMIDRCRGINIPLSVLMIGLTVRCYLPDSRVLLRCSPLGTLCNFPPLLSSHHFPAPLLRPLLFSPGKSS